jgi:hypothetical protein
MTRKHFKELAKILGENNADAKLITDIVFFCIENSKTFNLDTFEKAIEENRKENYVKV